MDSVSCSPSVWIALLVEQAVVLQGMPAMNTKLDCSNTSDSKIIVRNYQRDKLETQHCVTQSIACRFQTKALLCRRHFKSVALC